MDVRGKPESGPESRAPLVLRRDADGIATLTLNRPAARNALSVALMGALQQALDAISPATRQVKVVGHLPPHGPAFCAGHDLRELRANPGRAILRGVFAQCSRLMIQHRQAAEAGDRAGARRRHRGGLPAGRHLRSGGRRRRCALRHAGRQYRPVLLDADGGAVARGRPQAGDGDAAHRRSRSTRRAGARMGPRQPRRARGRLDRSGAGLPGRSPPSRRWC